MCVAWKWGRMRVFWRAVLGLSVGLIALSLHKRRRESSRVAPRQAVNCTLVGTRGVQVHPDQQLAFPAPEPSQLASQAHEKGALL